MNDYDAVVTLKVRVSAFSYDDALDAIDDMFGEGVDGDITVFTCDVEFDD